MIERNQPCPCGSGKKYKKCCGAGGAAKVGAAASAAQRADPSVSVDGVVDAPNSTTPGAPALAIPTSVPAITQEEKPFLVYMGRGLDSEKTEAARKKHLRKRIQERDLRGTMFYNSGAFFRPPEK